MRRSLTVALMLSLGSVMVAPWAQAAPAQDQAGLAAVVLSVVADVARAVNPTDDQKASIAKIVETHRDEFLAARASGDVAALRDIVHGAAQEAAAVLTPDQLDAAKMALQKALTDRGLPVPSF